MKHYYLNTPTNKYLVAEEDDVTEWLGITKYEPIVPETMSGEVCNVAGYTLKYDVENYKKYPYVLVEGTKVTLTEKIHGCASYETILDTVEYSNISIGDLVTQQKLPCHVKSYNTISNEIEYNLVEEVAELPNNNDWYEIELETGETVKLTGNHPVWLPLYNCYREVRLLTSEDVVLLNI